jgi:hypothetical protein
VLAVAIRVDVSVALTRFSIIATALLAGCWIVLDDEIVPVCDPQISVRPYVCGNG